jgi:hypothetical protein
MAPPAPAVLYLAAVLQRLTLRPTAMAAASRTVQADSRRRLELDQARLRAVLAGDLARSRRHPETPTSASATASSSSCLRRTAGGRRLELAPVTSAILGGRAR